MSDMVERVARAIYDAPNGIDGDQLADMLVEDCRITGADPAACQTQVLDVCRHVARAAIAAMREPTEAMVSKRAERPVTLQMSGLAMSAPLGASAAKDCWRAMIDAALQERG